MKRIITISCCLFLALGFILPVKTKAATEAYDQRCIIAAGNEGGTDLSTIEEFRLNQSFTPTKNRLTKISLYLKGTGTGNYHIDLYHNDNFIASTPSGPEPNGNFYVSQSFSEPVAVTPGDGNYRIIPRKSGDNTNLFWHDNFNCYDGGMAYHGNTPLDGPNIDFGFVTFGYDETSPADESVNGNSGTTNSDQSQLQNSNTGTSQEADQNLTSKEKATQNEQKILSSIEIMPLWQKIFFSLGILLVLAGIGYLIYRAVKRRREKNGTSHH